VQVHSTWSAEEADRGISARTFSEMADLFFDHDSGAVRVCRKNFASGDEGTKAERGVYEQIVRSFT
jgi:ribosomal protein L17